MTNISDYERAKKRMGSTPHCCPICCTAAQKGGHHSPLFLTEDEVWYCPNQIHKKE